MISFFLALVLAMVIIAVAAGKDNDAKEAKNYYTYEPYGDVINLKKRGPILKKCFTVEARTSYAFSYVPDKQLYTSVTVGGVTTGGVSTIKGGIQGVPTGKTGSYYLWCKYARESGVNRGEWSGAFITSIVLPSNLFERAKANNVLSKYVVQREHLESNSGYNSYKEKSLVVNNMSKSDCEYLLSWLCGEQDQIHTSQPQQKTANQQPRNTATSGAKVITAAGRAGTNLQNQTSFCMRYSKTNKACTYLDSAFYCTDCYSSSNHLNCPYKKL